MIPIETIPRSLKRPILAFEFNTSAASQGLPRNDKRLLLIGAKRSTGTAPANVARQVYTDRESEGLFGAGGPLDLMVKAAFKANPYSPIWALPVDEPAAGVAATGTLTVTGPATASGSLLVWIAGRRIEVGIANADTATTIAAAIAAAMTAMPTLPVSAAVGGGGSEHVVTLTAKTKGTWGNEIMLSRELIAATGVAVAVSAARLSGGTLAPAITTALAAVAGERFHLVALGQGDNGGSGTASRELRDHLNTCGNAINMRGQSGVVAEVVSQSAATTQSAALNGERVQVACLEGTPSLSCEVASAMGAVRAGWDHPARPLNGLELAGVVAPTIDYRFIDTELEAQLTAGVAPLVVNASGNVAILRSVSTRTKNASGDTDLALFDTTAIESLDYVREAVRTHIARVFPRYLYVDEDPGHRLPGEIVATNEDLKDQTLIVLRKLEGYGVVQKVEEYAGELVFEKDATEPSRALGSIPANLIPGLHQVYGRFNVRVL